MTSLKHDERIDLRVSADDLHYWRQAAEQARMKLSEWIRRSCDAALDPEVRSARMLALKKKQEEAGAKFDEVVVDLLLAEKRRADAARAKKRRGRRGGGR